MKIESSQSECFSNVNIYKIAIIICRVVELISNNNFYTTFKSS